jgi:hypothetical protein
VFGPGEAIVRILEATDTYPPVLGGLELRISLNPTTRNGVKAITCFGRIRSS